MINTYKFYDYLSEAANEAQNASTVLRCAAEKVRNCQMNSTQLRQEIFRVTLHRERADYLLSRVDIALRTEERRCLRRGVKP